MVNIPLSVKPPTTPHAAVAPSPVRLAARNLNFFYGKFHAVKNVNVEIRENRVTAFIGPSGCGKSTLLRVFNRMYDLYPHQRAEGEVLLDGENVLAAKDTRKLRSAGLRNVTALLGGLIKFARDVGHQRRANLGVGDSSHENYQHKRPRRKYDRGVVMNLGDLAGFVGHADTRRQPSGNALVELLPLQNFNHLLRRMLIDGFPLRNGVEQL